MTAVWFLIGFATGLLLALVVIAIAWSGAHTNECLPDHLNREPR